MGYKLELNKQQIDFLSQLPEHGMGYHIVDITLKDGRVMKGRIVLNSTYLKLDESEHFKADDIGKIELHIN